jgi:hypothetical protein
MSEDEEREAERAQRVQLPRKLGKTQSQQVLTSIIAFFVDFALLRAGCFPPSKS